MPTVVSSSIDENGRITYVYDDGSSQTFDPSTGGVVESRGSINPAAPGTGSGPSVYTDPQGNIRYNNPSMGNPIATPAPKPTISSTPAPTPEPPPEPKPDVVLLKATPTDTEPTYQITKENWNKLDPKYQQMANEQGWNKVIETIRDDQAKEDAALKELKPYDDGKGNYNINKFLLDNHKNAIQTLRDAGFSWEEIQQATHENLAVAQEARKQVEDEHSTWGTAKYTGHLIADMVVPGLSTAENWGHLATWQKIVYPALDVVTLIPVAGQVARGVEIGAKGLSVGAKIASLGGPEAVELAAKDAATQLEGAVEKKGAQEALLKKAVSMAENENNPVMKSIRLAAVDEAKTDVQIVNKQLTHLTQNVDDLNKLAEAAKTDTAASLGTKVYQGAEKVENLPEKIKVGGVSAEAVVSKGGAAAFSTVAGTTTIKDWNDLTPVQKVAGILMTILPVGGLGKARNLAEDVADPSKIPLKAMQTRTVGAEIKPGQLFSEAGGAGGGTVRLVLDAKATPEQARDAMAKLMRQAHEEGKTAIVEYAGHEVKLPGTGFQKTVGGEVSFSATPHGEVFKQGTGAFGTKSRLESYLTAVNEKLGSDKPITIEATYKGKDPLTGEMIDKTISTDVKPGVTVSGTEGGLYTAPTVANKFAHQAAYGSKGQLQATLIIHDAGIEGLPRSIAREKMGEMEVAAEKLFNGARHTDEVVEGFKKYRIFAEGENVITNGSQIQRVQNLRSKLTDALHLNRGEYYTRDPKGRIELFQMYVEGGRTTPYTLKEIYQLKGNALRNALGDIIPGLRGKIRELTGKAETPREDLAATKEETIAKAFGEIDEQLKNGDITPQKALEEKRIAMEDARDTAKEDLRKEAVDYARDKELEHLRKGSEEGADTEEVRTETEPERARESPAATRAELPTTEGFTATARSDTSRVDTTRTNNVRADSTRPATTDRKTTDRATDRTTPDRTTTRLPAKTTPVRSNTARPTTRTGSDRPITRTETERPVVRTDERPPTERPPRATDKPPRTDHPPTERPDRPPRERPPTRFEPHPPKTLKLPHKPSPGGHTDQTEWPDGTIVWNQGELGGRVIHHISPYPYEVEYTSFLPPKGMKNSHLTTTKETVQALGGRVFRDADLQIGFEVAHIRKGSSDIYFTQDPELSGVRRPPTSRVPAPGRGTAKGSPVKLVKMHATAHGGITRRSDR